MDRAASRGAGHLQLDGRVVPARDGRGRAAYRGGAGGRAERGAERPHWIAGGDDRRVERADPRHHAIALGGGRPRLDRDGDRPGGHAVGNDHHDARVGPAPHRGGVASDGDRPRALDRSKARAVEGHPQPHRALGGMDRGEQRDRTGVDHPRPARRRQLLVAGGVGRSNRELVGPKGEPALGDGADARRPCAGVDATLEARGVVGGELEARRELISRLRRAAHDRGRRRGGVDGPGPALGRPGGVGGAGLEAVRSIGEALVRDHRAARRERVRVQPAHDRAAGLLALDPHLGVHPVGERVRPGDDAHARAGGRWCRIDGLRCCVDGRARALTPTRADERREQHDPGARPRPQQATLKNMRAKVASPRRRRRLR